ncbi:hypothetical protein TanjilG_30989 [Lupinus angustifolius]|uniref:Uncharacterized protein n=2 Tax=Lupinus angustifolius TaxID=3871 RepID=A0A1J7HMG8_LUPAN|nr:PREDICTED: uncharacterized protein LOC109358495 isoform X2 [Lupinus angustifolius]OIW03569.1 hypothetical protein TanjilG_30989 [Lupinus angustifolius]
MHCAPQEIDNDSPKVSEAGKDSTSTIYQQQNKRTSLENCEESSLSRINSGSRCAVISFLNFEPDGTWRVIAVPVRVLNHINVSSGVNMDSLQLISPPPLNRLKMGQCKGPRGPPFPYAYSAKRFTRSITGSNVHRRYQNKIANKASKSNELPRNSCSGSSSVCSYGSFPDCSDVVSSSDKFTSNSKADKSLKKNSRRKIRKKVKQGKKQSLDNGPTEREALNEEYVCGSLTSESCSSNDVEPESSSSDDRLIKNDCERNEMYDVVNIMEAPKSSNSFIDEIEMLKATAPNIQNSAGEYATFESKSQLQGRNPGLLVLDGETKDIPQADLNCFNDIQDISVLDSLSIGSKSDESMKAGDIGKRSNKARRKITSNSGDGYFLGQNVTNGNPNNGAHNEGVRQGGQDCFGNDNQAKQKRAVSKSSSFSKFGGVGISHGQAGKENSHSVWQKVQKNNSVECGDSHLKKVNTASSQFGSPVKRDPSVIRKSGPASENFLSKMEDKKQFKNKAGQKSKGKMDSVSKKEQCSYSRKGYHFNRSMLNDDVKVTVQQNDNNQQGLSNVSGFNSDINCMMYGFQTNRVEQITSEVVHSAEFHLEESDPQTSPFHTIANMKNENTDIQHSPLSIPGAKITPSNMCEEQHQVSYNHLGDEVVQTEKGVSSADSNAHHHSSISTLWKWIPIVKKDTALAEAKSKSSFPEFSDAPSCKNSNLESSVEPRVASSSQNRDSSLNVSRTFVGRMYSKMSCLDESENQNLEKQGACTLTEHRDKRAVANHVIHACHNQDTLGNDSCTISQAVNNTHRTQLACEAVHMATGGPIAEFERLLHFCSPVICQPAASVSCLTCSHDNADGASLCRHEMPNLSLRYLWLWYEKHGSYGLEVRAQDYEYSKGVGGADQFPFRAYFVPSLSAVQLFKNSKNQCVNSSEMIGISEHSPTASRHPIFSVLFPKPRNQDASIETSTTISSINNASNSSVNSKCSGDLELLFEYFELEQPQQRQPLYEKIKELVSGAIPIHSKTYGDPTKLDSINLQDLHPSSWYSVAWYPIYRIPDGNFRASFLTYHSLGHLVRRSTNSNCPTLGSSIVSPAVGLQSYNAQGECWFRLKHSARKTETLGLNPSLLLKERLRTLEETASIMARAVVNKGNQICTNRHPDYEFFLSRRRY